ncbi:hypothetical protein M407DRAFT_245683 [Tulasnella calospora MUT 4182]|uniref:Uncharacterized protein n=1 Tax=Tulasnella calospora MUT 4182 TaxID=1051891 RepID=A0A0C3LHA1_9AGAM|nr:hypothetical protein M407DRAFT_245683 [Tulasnella calospora MUT 4182]
MLKKERPQESIFSTDFLKTFLVRRSLPASPYRNPKKQGVDSPSYEQEHPAGLTSIYHRVILTTHMARCVHLRNRNR